MTVIEIFKAKDGGFCFRLMGKNYKEIWRASETYKRKATMMKTMSRYCPIASGAPAIVPVVDLILLSKESLKKKASVGTITDKRRRPVPTKPVEPPVRKKK